MNTVSIKIDGMRIVSVPRQAVGENGLVAVIERGGFSVAAGQSWAR